MSTLSPRDIPTRCPIRAPFLGENCGMGALLSVLLVAMMWAGSPSSLHAQEPTPETPVYRVEMAEGTVLIGTLISETDEEIVLDTRTLGQVTLQRANVESMERIDPDRLHDGEYWFQNPQSTRYFFSPNAIGIPDGHGYYQNTWILFNNVNVGVSDNFSIGAGMVPIFLFGADAVPLWVLPKASMSIPNYNLHIAGGAVLGGVLADDGMGLGLLYGATTVGTRNHNATIALGYGYSGEGISEAPVVNISGMTRIGKTFYLISENYFFSDNYFLSDDETGQIISLGLRWAPENFAVDFALARPLSNAEDFIGFPWLGVTIPFGN